MHLQKSNDPPCNPKLVGQVFKEQTLFNGNFYITALLEKSSDSSPPVPVLQQGCSYIQFKLV